MRHRINPWSSPLMRHRHYVTAPRNWSPGELVTSNMMNTLRDLFLEIEAGTADMQKVLMTGRTSAALSSDLSASGKAKIAYDSTLGKIVASLNGGAYGSLGGGIEQFPIPAAAWRPLSTGGCGWHEEVLSTNPILGMPFDGTTSEGAWCQVRMPDNWNKGTFTAEFETINKTGSGAFVFSLAALATSDADAISGALGTAQQVTDTILTAYQRQRSAATAAITAAGSPANGDYLLFVVHRLPADAADTATGIDVYLTGVTLHIGVTG